MANMHETIARLRSVRSIPKGPATAASRLRPMPAVALNPGGLMAKVHVPANLPTGSPLVVVLHGCTQTAEAYDAGTGWSRLADKAGVALLFPEQSAVNNPNLCFNWFQSDDIARCGGEAESIARMVAEMIERHALDAGRVFVTGLSAGGAMAAVMLATYPDLFAGGAIIGGLPYNQATGVGPALQLMAGRGRADPAGAVAVARRASGITPERWPTVSLWHGTADHTVVVGNMDDLASQWCGVHGVDPADGRAVQDGAVERRTWSIGDRVVVETRRIAGMGHGVPIDPSSAQAPGHAGPYMLPVGVDSTTEIARFWGILPAESSRGDQSADAPAASDRSPLPQDGHVATGVQKVIEDALRSAGLMR